MIHVSEFLSIERLLRRIFWGTLLFALALRLYITFGGVGPSCDVFSDMVGWLLFMSGIRHLRRVGAGAEYQRRIMRARGVGWCLIVPVLMGFVDLSAFPLWATLESILGVVYQLSVLALARAIMQLVHVAGLERLERSWLATYRLVLYGGLNPSMAVMAVGEFGSLMGISSVQQNYYTTCADLTISAGVPIAVFVPLLV